MAPTPKNDEETPVVAAKPVWQRLLPLMVIVIVLISFFALGLHKYFTLDTLKEQRETLTGFAQDNLILAVLIMIGIYAGAVSISFPGASLLSIFCGFMFGPLIGGSVIVVGATIGATIIFIVGRQAAGDMLAKSAGGYMAKLEAGFSKNAFTYLLILRLIPAVPFWVLNLAAAAFRVPLRTYVLATFIGIIPGCFVYAGVGDGIGAAFDSGSDINLGIIFEPRILLPLIGLAVLATLPLVYQKIKGGNASNSKEAS
ncbi:MAG: TVP38/TMEM64 family protein [Robiginitomaculum sp.]|nr:TVP38/TMEM64 family protein [Robiginitomaculum sp.]